MFGSVRVVPPPGSFLQATVEGQNALIASVLDALGTCRPVVDLFSGCGTFSLPAATARKVHAVENGEQMLEALDTAWRHGRGLHEGKQSSSAICFAAL